MQDDDTNVSYGTPATKYGFQTQTCSSHPMILFVTFHDRDCDVVYGNNWNVNKSCFLLQSHHIISFSFPFIHFRRDNKYSLYTWLLRACSFSIFLSIIKRNVLHSTRVEHEIMHDVTNKFPNNQGGDLQKLIHKTPSFQILRVLQVCHNVQKYDMFMKLHVHQ